MNTLVIYAHPNIEGHCSTILKNVELELNTLNQQYEILNLYKLKFDPILHEDELYSSGKKTKYSDVEQIQKKILAAEKLIFIYPIWWNSPPAILRGFVDRVFSSGFGFKYRKKLGIMMPDGLLKGKTAVVFHTSGSPNFVFNSINGARGSKNITTDTLKFCGIKSKGFNYGQAIKVTPEVEKKLEVFVKKGMNWAY